MDVSQDILPIIKYPQIFYCGGERIPSAATNGGHTQASFLFVAAALLVWSTSNWHQKVNKRRLSTSMARHIVVRGATRGVGGGKGWQKGQHALLARKLRNKKAAKLRLLKEFFPWTKRKPKVDRKPRIKNRTHLEYCPAMHAHGACTCFDHLLQQTPKSPRMFSPEVRVATPETPSAKHLQRTRAGVERQWGIRSDIQAFPERDASDPANEPCARCHHMECSADRCK